MKTLEVEVADIRKITGEGNVKAFAQVKVGGCLLIKDMRIMKGKNGVFVSMPRKTSKDGRWFDVLEPDESLRQAIEEKVLQAYGLETDGVND